MKRRQDKRKSVYECDQPFDLFEEFERGPAPRRQAVQQTRSHSVAPRNILIVAVSFFTLVVMASAFIGFMSKPSEKKPFVLVEFRAISDSGHPVAGAHVYLEKKKFGVTDSFGEWRRYLRLRPGRELNVKISKGSSDSPYIATKEVQVPQFDKGGTDLELKMTLELSKKIYKKSAKNKVQRKSRRKYAISSGRDSEAPIETYQPARPKAVSLGSQMGNFRDSDKLNEISINFVPFKNKYGTLMEAHQSRILGVKIVPEMIAQAAEDGLRVKRRSDFRLDIQYIPHAGQVGFVKGAVSWKQSGIVLSRSFTTNFSKTITETADKLLNLAKTHVNRPYQAFNENGGWVLGQGSMPKFWSLRHGLKLLNKNGQIFSLASKGGQDLAIRGKPCSSRKNRCSMASPSTKEFPPNAGWTKQKIGFAQALPERAEVYVNGFQAFDRRGSYEFWGTPNKPHRLMIIRDGQIFHRTKIIPSKSHILKVNLPMRIARR